MRLNRTLRIGSLLLLSGTLFACSGGSGPDSGDGKGDGTMNEKAPQGGNGGSQGRQGQGQQPRTQGPGQGQRGSVDLDVSKEELKAFNEIREEVRPLQKEQQKKHREVVENSDMGEERYQRIVMAQRQDQSPDISEEEQKEMEEIQKKGEEIQKKLQEKVMEKVEENEALDESRFSEIARGIQQDPELQQRLQKLSGEGGGGPQQRGAPQQRSAPQGGGGRTP